MSREGTAYRDRQRAFVCLSLLDATHDYIVALLSRKLFRVRAHALSRQAGGVRVVFQAMRRLVGNAEVQVKGADMLQALINEEPQVRNKKGGVVHTWRLFDRLAKDSPAETAQLPDERPRRPKLQRSITFLPRPS